MPKAYSTWTVHRHGPIEKLTPNLWRVVGSMSGPPVPRTMVLVRLRDGRVIVHSAVALDDAAMKEIEAWGTPAFLVVPNGGHRMDAKIFKDRYPGMHVIAPPGSKAKVEEVTKVDDSGASLGEDGVRYEVLDGTKGREGVLFVRSAAGTTLVFNDTLMNMKSLPGFSGTLMGLFGFTGPAPKVAFPARVALVADKRALRSHLERLADTQDLTRIEVGHGAPVTEHPAEALRAAAKGLS